MIKPKTDKETNETARAKTLRGEILLRLAELQSLNAIREAEIKLAMFYFKKVLIEKTPTRTDCTE